MDNFAFSPDPNFRRGGNSAGSPSVRQMNGLFTTEPIKYQTRPYEQNPEKVIKK